MSKAKPSYGNDSISSLKGADRVRKRPGVIFGSDGLEGCEHAVFEILSNSIDEAREGYGTDITTVRYADGSIEVSDHGRGIPVEWNEKEQRYNWELVFCELYAGGKYKNDTGENYEFSLGLNGLGTCATQYSSEYMDVTIVRDGFEYGLHFEKGENRTGTKEGFTKKPTNARKTGTTIRWKPDLEVFTDINIPVDYYLDTLKRQAVVNSHIKFVLKNQVSGSKFDTTEFLYQNGIVDYVGELAGETPLTSVQFLEGERRGRDRADKSEYKVKLSCAFCFSSAVSRIEYYHNSSWLEHGGAPDKAVRSAFVSAIDAYLKQNNKYNKSESKVTYQDIFDSLVLVTNCFSTQTSYENQTKKAITNRFIQEAMTEFLKEGLEIYFIENKSEADKIAEQILINKRSREQAEKARLNIKKKLSGNIDLANRVQKFVDCRTKDVARRELYIVEGDSALGSVKQGRDSEFQAIMPVRGKILNCLKAHYRLAQGPRLRRRGAWQGGEGSVGVRPRQPAVAPRHHLHRCRCGRLPDPHADPDHDLPPRPDAHRAGLCLYRGVSALRDHLSRQELFCLRRDRKGGYPQKARGQEDPHPALQGSGREPGGHDVGDYHEP